MFFGGLSMGVAIGTEIIALKIGFFIVAAVFAFALHHQPRRP